MTFVIGIAGGTGSGKTTLATRLLASVGEAQALILHQDAYYKNHAELPLHDRDTLNYDHPDAIDWPLLLEQVDALRAGRPISMPVYDFHNHARRPQSKLMPARPIILVEGILIFDRPQLRSLMHLKLFVETDADVRFIRRLERDVRDRGRTPESVVKQYLATVRPMHLQFVEPSKRFADLIIPEGGHGEMAVDTVLSQIRARITASGAEA
jgi:uridine kinase